MTKFEEFKVAWEAARADPTKKEEAGRLLSEAIQTANLTNRDIENARIADRTSLHRWIRGVNMPQLAQIILLEQVIEPKGAEHTALAISLLEPRYRPVIAFTLEVEAAGGMLTVNQLIELLDLAKRSKGMLTVELMRAYSGM